MTEKTTSKSGQKICADCILKKSCEYIPDEFDLIRCLDKVTAGGNQPGAEEEEEAE